MLRSASGYCAFKLFQAFVLAFSAILFAPSDLSLRGAGCEVVSPSGSELAELNIFYCFYNPNCCVDDYCRFKVIRRVISENLSLRLVNCSFSAIFKIRIFSLTMIWLISLELNDVFKPSTIKVKSLTNYPVHCDPLDPIENVFNGEPLSVLGCFDIVGQPFDRMDYHFEIPTQRKISPRIRIFVTNKNMEIIKDESYGDHLL